MKDSATEVRAEVRGTTVHGFEEAERGQILSALEQTSWRIEGNKRGGGNSQAQAKYTA